MLDQYWVHYEDERYIAPGIVSPTRMAFSVQAGWQRATKMVLQQGGRAVIRAEDGVVVGAVRRR